MPSFQQWFVELVSMISDASVAIAAIAGIASISQWRREMTGKSKFELAKKIMTTIFKVQKHFDEARHRFPLEDSSKTRNKSPNKSVEVSKIRDEYHARLLHLKPLEESLNELREYSWEASLILDKNFESYTEPYFQLYRKLVSSIYGWFVAQESQANGNTSQNIEEFQKSKELALVVYGVKGDEFSTEVSKTTANLRKIMRKLLN